MPNKIDEITKSTYVNAMRTASDPDGDRTHKDYDKVIARASKYQGKKFGKALDGVPAGHWPKQNVSYGIDHLKLRDKADTKKSGKITVNHANRLKYNISYALKKYAKLKEEQENDQMNDGIEEGIIKKIGRSLKGWGDGIHPKEMADYHKKASTSELLRLMPNEKDTPPNKGTPRALQVKLVRREMNRRLKIKPHKNPYNEETMKEGLEGATKQLVNAIAKQKTKRLNQERGSLPKPEVKHGLRALNNSFVMERISEHLETALDLRRIEIADNIFAISEDRVSKRYAATVDLNDPAARERVAAAKKRIFNALPGKIKIAAMGRGPTDAGRSLVKSRGNFSGHTLPAKPEFAHKADLYSTDKTKWNRQKGMVPTAEFPATPKQHLMIKKILAKAASGSTGSTHQVKNTGHLDMKA